MGSGWRSRRAGKTMWRARSRAEPAFDQSCLRSIDPALDTLKVTLTWCQNSGAMRTMFLFSALVTAALAFAQSAPNYDCAHAIMLPVAGSKIQAYVGIMGGISLLPSTPVPPVACPGTVPARSGWFSFVATAGTHWVR